MPPRLTPSCAASARSQRTLLEAEGVPFRGGPSRRAGGTPLRVSFAQLAHPSSRRTGSLGLHDDLAALAGTLRI